MSEPRTPLKKAVVAQRYEQRDEIHKKAVHAERLQCKHVLARIVGRRRAALRSNSGDNRAGQRYSRDGGRI